MIIWRFHLCLVGSSFHWRAQRTGKKNSALAENQPYCMHCRGVYRRGVHWLMFEIRIRSEIFEFKFDPIQDRCRSEIFESEADPKFLNPNPIRNFVYSKLSFLITSNVSSSRVFRANTNVGNRVQHKLQNVHYVDFAIRHKIQSTK